MKESTVQGHIRLVGAQLDVELWRNNSGAFEDASGRWVRYGLANDSKQLNGEIKSSDLIGGTPEIAFLQRTGQWHKVSILTAIEVKPSDWTFPAPTNKDEFAHCLAQSRFHDIVRAAGGYAGFAASVEDFKRIIGR